MSWASKRQLVIVTILIMALMVIGGVLSLPYFLKAPTCADGVQNGTETGIDCGGSCEKFCPFEVNELKLLWARPFKVADGAYDVLAYIDNQNANAGIKKILYRFRLYDERNLFITERVGRTYVTANGPFAVFEGSIRTGSLVPKRVFFEFVEVPVWVKMPAKANSFSLGKSVSRLESETTRPRLLVSVSNNSLYDASDIETTAILYDEKENAFAVSRTVVDALGKGESKDLVFTWLLPFEKTPTRIEILPRTNVFNINF